MWEVIGQPKALNFLERSIEGGHLAHAYLFVGPQHTGKMTLAINLAQALNCEGEKPPCGQCYQCRRIATGNHADVQIIRHSGKVIGIDKIRDMEHNLNLGPYEGRSKVFIIDESEHLNQESANALLKTLEEPPSTAFLILLAVNEESLPPTIVSRCQILRFFPLPTSLIKQELKKKWKIPPEKAENLAQICDGSIGWAISAYLDENLPLNRRKILNELIKLTDAGLNERFAYAAELANKYSKNQGKVEEIFDLWIKWWEDLLLIKGGAPEFIANIDYEDMLLQQAKSLNLTEIRDFIKVIQLAEEQLEQNANPSLAIEVLMLGFPKRGFKGYG